MLDKEQRLTAPEGVPLPVSIAVVIGLALVTWLAAPVMRHFPGAIIPWPVHGIAVAALLIGRPKDRGFLAVLLLVAVILAGILRTGNVARAVVAAALMTAQTICVVLLHLRLSGRAHPLRSVRSYALLGVAVIIGIIPTTLIASTLAPILDPSVAGAFTFWGWWRAGVTSMAALTPIVMAPTAPFPAEMSGSKAQRFEFPLLALAYAVALLFGFFTSATDTYTLPPAVATVPFLIWAGLRFGIRGYAFFAAMFATAAIGSTLTHVGPFAVFGPDVIVRGARAWVYVASLAGPTMIFPVALSERAAVDARMRAAFAQLAAIVESSADLIAAVDRDLVVIAANPAWVDEFERISGTRVRVGMRMEDALVGVPGDRDATMTYWRRALAGERFTVTREVGDPNRARDEYEISYSPVRDESGVMVGASQVVRNITQRRQHETAAANARRLEALGRLAGGVAHDFNNLMTSVIGYADLVATSLPPSDERQQDLKVILEAAGRAGELTQQLLAFARRQVLEPREVNVAQLVDGFTRLIAPLLGSTVKLTLKVAPALPMARLDPVQFEQVLMNLAVNARDAMPNGGELTVEVSPSMAGGREGIRLSVRDTGHGMSTEVLERIWEPFYTTKESGKGTGLGLATVHGIVHQAGGDISVQTEVGVGTTFHVFFPASESGSAAV